MGQSLVKNYLHIIFSTKGRLPIVIDPMASQLYEYLFGICREIECYPIRIGGHLDHVHILCELSKKMTIVKMMETVKSNSSRWIKQQGSAFTQFYWQAGYGAFSVNPKEIQLVEKYIVDQPIHHQHKTFQDEYRGFLTAYKIPFDERYVWD